MWRIKRFHLAELTVTNIVFLIFTSTLFGQFPDAHEPPPEGWTGPVFMLSQDYPAAAPTDSDFPWMSIDFRTHPKEYLNAVLEYVYAGNIEVTWRVQDNATRKWYHAPWMHWGTRGREFIHGMTRERTSLAGELSPTQTSRFQNWAVGFYNAPGGYVIGQVWKDPTNPDVTKAKFPNGTVSAKLLFSAATVDEVPYIEGAFGWQGNVLTSLSSEDRTPKMMHLLQIDVAVRDTRGDDTTGWVFGTFVYHKDHEGTNAFEKMRAVGLMWGNDPGVTPEMVEGGTALVETWLNPDVSLQHYGWAGRLNGPVDNPISSCLSCHSTAQIPSSSPMVFRPTDDTDSRLNWFRNLKAGEAFDSGSVSADYSLQLAFGIVNFLQSRQAPFATLAARQAGLRRAKSMAASSEYFDELQKVSQDLDAPFEVEGKRYYPISRGE